MALFFLSSLFTVCSNFGYAVLCLIFWQVVPTSERAKGFMSKSGFSSNANVFAKRGDPWLSRREGVEDYSRDPETEDAEYDFDHRFHHSRDAIGKPRLAPKREPYRDPKGQPTENDIHRRVANIRQKHRLARRARLVDVKEKEPPRVPAKKERNRRLRDVEAVTAQAIETVNGTAVVAIQRLHGYCVVLVNGEPVASARKHRDAAATAHAIELQLYELDYIVPVAPRYAGRFT